MRKEVSNPRGRVHNVFTEQKTTKREPMKRAALLKYCILLLTPLATLAILRLSGFLLFPVDRVDVAW